MKWISLVISDSGFGILHKLRFREALLDDADGRRDIAPVRFSQTILSLMGRQEMLNAGKPNSGNNILSDLVQSRQLTLY